MIYQIKVKGKLDPSWSDWLGGLEITLEGGDQDPISLLTGTITDQPALFSILERIRDMNLLPVSVVRIDEENN